MANKVKTIPKKKLTKEQKKSWLSKLIYKIKK